MIRPLFVLLLAGWWLVHAAAVWAETGVGAPGGPLPARQVLASYPPEIHHELSRRGLVVLNRYDRHGQSLGEGMRALVHFERPLPEVFDLLRATQRQREYRPELHRVVLLENGNASRVDRQQIRMALLTVGFHLRTQWQREAGRVHWALDPRYEHDVQRLEGDWQLHPGDSGTLGRLRTRVEFGPAIPRWLQSQAASASLPRTLDRLRRWVNSGGTWRP